MDKNKDSKRQYGERDIIGMGEYYTRHVSAMTSEGLHAKWEIAAELGLVDAKREKGAGRKVTLIRWSVLGAVLARAYLEMDGAIQNAIKERQGESSVH